MQLEIAPEARQKLMRHSSLTTTEHYTHVSPEWLEKQAGRFAELIDNLETNIEKIASTSETLKVETASKRPSYLRLVK